MGLLHIFRTQPLSSSSSVKPKLGLFLFLSQRAFGNRRQLLQQTRKNPLKGRKRWRAQKRKKERTPHLTPPLSLSISTFSLSASSSFATGGEQWRRRRPSSPTRLKPGLWCFSKWRWLFAPLSPKRRLPCHLQNPLLPHYQGKDSRCC